MFVHKFQTKFEKRKTSWKRPKRVIGKRIKYWDNIKDNRILLSNSNGVQLITSEYNKYGEVTSIASTNGRTTYMEYDNNGDCIATYYIENGYKILDKTFYDDARRVIGREHWIIQMGAGVQPLGGGTSNIAPPKLLWSTTTEYNAAGQVIREIDQNGLETLYTYDVRGLETEVRSQSKGSDGQIIWSIQRTVYDAAGRSTYSNSYTEGIPATQINGSHSEYDKDGRSIRSEQLTRKRYGY
jgi:YD repeat-containing protein